MSRAPSKYSLADVTKKMGDLEHKLRENRYSGATVWVKGKLVMENGEVLDDEWWKRKWKRRKNQN